MDAEQRRQLREKLTFRQWTPEECRTQALAVLDALEAAEQRMVTAMTALEHLAASACPMDAAAAKEAVRAIRLREMGAMSPGELAHVISLFQDDGALSERGEK